MAPPGKGDTTSEAPHGVPRTTWRLRSQMQSLGESKSGICIPRMSLEPVSFSPSAHRRFPGIRSVSLE